MIWQGWAFMFRQVLVVTECWWPGSGVVALAGSWLAEQVGERVDYFEEQRVDAGLLVGEAAGAELGDRAAVLSLGGELADPGGHSWVDGCRAARSSSRG
jgi:hypothetical protein